MGIVAVVAVALLVFSIIEGIRDSSELPICLFWSAVVTAFIGLILAIPATSLGDWLYEAEEFHNESVRETEVVALGNASETEGQLRGGGVFVLALGGGAVSGSMENELYYVFYHKDRNNEVHLEKRTPDDVRLFEEDREDAIFQVRNVTYGHEGVLGFWGFVIPESNTKETEYILRVPEGTVVRSVSLDIDDLD